MRSVTGLELGADTCVLARIRPQHESIQVSAVHGLRPVDGSSQEESLAEHLGRVRRSKGFPKRARVVAWGLHESASATDAATRAALGPLLQAGFSIDDVLTPAEALAILARRRPRPAGREAEAWLSLNRHAAAIAIVHGGELLFSREFDWHYRPGASSREELLQRYSLVAHLASELRHGFDVVRAEHGILVDAIVTCGDLPDLRSLTMPLIEELDIEVETLDSLDGIEVVRPARIGEIAEKAPALRLACAAGIGRAIEVRRESSWVPLAAAVALLALLVWGAMQFVGTTDDRPAASGAPPRPGPLTVQQQTQRSAEAQSPQPSTVVSPAPAPAPTPPVERPRDPAAVPEATMGRRAPVTGEQRSSGRAERPQPMIEPVPSRPRQGRAGVSSGSSEAATTRPPVPLKDPLPVVNSILVAPDRRLAVVDGAIVREGEAVGPRVLIRIEPGAVVLREPSGYEVRIPIRRRIGAV